MMRSLQKRIEAIERSRDPAPPVFLLFLYAEDDRTAAKRWLTAREAEWPDTQFIVYDTNLTRGPAVGRQPWEMDA